MPPEVEHRQWGKVEWNPSRMVDPDGWGLASVEEALLTVGRALSAADELLERVDPDARSSSVKRIDVAKDIHEVDEVSSMIRALGAIPRKYSRLNMTHADPKRSGAQTLLVGSGAGVTRLYDKHEETAGDAPKGTVRFEIEGREWLSRYGGMKKLGDVNASAIEAFGRERWEWSQMGAEVASSTARLVAMVAESDLTVAQQASFLGWLVMQSAGVSEALSNKTEVKYRKLQRDLGIVAPADFGSMVEVVRRLDWDSAREVVSVRAA